MKRRSLDRTLLDAIRTFFWGRIFLILNWISEYHPSNQMLEDLTMMIIVKMVMMVSMMQRILVFGVRQDDFLEMEMVMMIILIRVFMMITMMIEVMLCVVRQDNPLTRLRLFLLSSLNRWWDGIMIIIIVITITSASISTTTSTSTSTSKSTSQPAHQTVDNSTSWFYRSCSRSLW